MQMQDEPDAGGVDGWNVAPVDTEGPPRPYGDWSDDDARNIRASNAAFSQLLFADNLSGQTPRRPATMKQAGA